MCLKLYIGRNELSIQEIGCCICYAGQKYFCLLQKTYEMRSSELSDTNWVMLRVAPAPFRASSNFLLLSQSAGCKLNFKQPPEHFRKLGHLLISIPLQFRNLPQLYKGEICNTPQSSHFMQKSIDIQYSVLVRGPQLLSPNSQPK